MDIVDFSRFNRSSKPAATRRLQDGPAHAVLQLRLQGEATTEIPIWIHQSGSVQDADMLNRGELKHLRIVRRNGDGTLLYGYGLGYVFDAKFDDRSRIVPNCREIIRREGDIFVLEDGTSVPVNQVEEFGKVPRTPRFDYLRPHAAMYAPITQAEQSAENYG